MLLKRLSIRIDEIENGLILDTSNSLVGFAGE